MIKFLKPKGKFAIAMYVIYEAALTMFPVNNDCQRLFQHNLSQILLYFFPILSAFKSMRT